MRFACSTTLIFHIMKEVENRNCQICDKEFEAKDKRKIYCSSACKTEAYRLRHGLEKPDFLKPKEALGGIKKEKKAVEREKIVIVKVDNPEYVAKELEVKKISSDITMLQKHKEAKLKKYNSLLEKHEQIVGGLIGGSFGAILGGAIGRNTGEKLAFGALGALFFGLIGNNIGRNVRDEKEARIVKEFEKIKAEIDKLEGEITEKQLQAFYEKSALSGINRQNLVEKVEKYVEYIEVDNLKDLLDDKVAEPIQVSTKKNQGQNSKVMSLDAFKQVKIDTLDVKSKSPEFYEVLGNPTGNFRMMVYGENYNGKSTYALKLAEFLSKNFGRVLFNSSEEGISTSLQNKIKEMNSNMLDLSFTRHTRSW